MDSLRTEFRIKKRKIIKKTLGSFFAIGLLSVFLAVLINMQGGINESINNHAGNTVFTSLIILAFCIVLVWSLIYQWLYFRSYHYASDDQNILIRKGVIGKTEITLPYSRITDMYVDQDILDRIFGLCDLHFSTATTSSSVEAHIDGLNSKDCESLKNIILERMNQN